MKRGHLNLTFFLITLLVAPAAFGQTLTGLPPFASLAPSTFDTVNQGNNNVFFSIPMVNKAGRGMPFTYSLGYSSTMWSPWNSLGSHAWTPVGNWGWAGITSANTGYVAYTWQQGSCYSGDYDEYFYWDIYNYNTYIDPNGTAHNLGGQVVDDWDDSIPCGSSYGNGPDTINLTDGSGYTVIVDDGPSATIYPRSGIQIYLNVEVQSGFGTITDTNGNTLSISTSSGTTSFTDTLGATALSVAPGSGVSNTYTYKDSSNTSRLYTVSYTSKTVRTNFGCSGYTEYGPSSQYLVSSITLPDSTTYSFTYEATPGYSGDVTGRIASVTLPTGGEITYSYSGGNNGIICQDGSTATLSRYTPDSANPWVYAHTESPPSWTTTVTDPLSNQTVIDFYGDYGGDSYETERKVYNPSSTLMETVDTCYNGSSLPCLSTTVSLPISNKKVEVTWPSLSPSETYTTYNSYGLPTEVDEYNYGPSLVRKTLTTYATPGTYINDRPSDIQIKDSGGTLQARSHYTYNSYGNLTEEDRYTGTSTYLSRSFSYSGYGVLASATDFNSNTTSITSYDCDGSTAYPSGISLPGSLSGSITWNCYVGLPSSIADVNTNSTSLSYDLMVRPTGTSLPDGGSLTTDYTSSTVRDLYTLTYGSTSRHDQVDLDGLGRVTTNALVNDPDSETYVTTTYDADGRVAYVSNPYRSSPPGVGDSYQYDALNRVTQVTHADSSYAQIQYGTASQSCSSSTYGYGYSVLYTDESGNNRQTFTDALGRLIEADEPTSSSNSLSVSTCYKYDVLGDLTEVDQGSETRYYYFDMLARLTQSATPEGQGSSKYFYYTTSGGSLCSGDPSAVCRRTDERSITTTYTYDALNRLTGKSYSNGDTSVSYTYDETSCRDLGSCYNYGQRTSMSDASGTTHWAYDKMGRVWEEKRTIGSLTEALYYTYNDDGSLASVTYPSGRTVTYTVSAVGRPVTAIDTGDSIDYVGSGNATYAAQGTLATAPFGADITFYANYSPYRLWPTTIEGYTSGTTFFELQPAYNSNGTVSSVTNALNSNRTQSFTYDYLNRVITAQSTATSGTYCWGQSIPTDGTGYDRYGNLLKINSSQCSSPGLNVSVNTYNQITNNPFRYDNSGNIELDGAYQYWWNAESQLKGLNYQNNYIYDGDGRRVKNTLSGYYYWFSPDGSPLAETNSSGTTQNEYVYFSGGRTARRDSSGNVYYYFSDQIGTAQLLTNTSGTVCYDSDFTPFGHEMAYTTTCSQDYKFGGMERDSATGNDHTWFRGYEPNLGRWMSPDLLGGDVSNPQSLNRYSYVLNNPVSLTDPLGLNDCADPWYANSQAECPQPAPDCNTELSGPDCTYADGDWGPGPGGGPSQPPVIAVPIPGGPISDVSDSLVGNGCINPTLLTKLSILAAMWAARILNKAGDGQTKSVSYGFGGSGGGMYKWGIGGSASASWGDTVDIYGNAAQTSVIQISPANPTVGYGGVAGVQVGLSNKSVPTTPQSSIGRAVDPTISVGGGAGVGANIDWGTISGARTLTIGAAAGGKGVAPVIFPVLAIIGSTPYCRSGKIW